MIQFNFKLITSVIGLNLIALSAFAELTIERSVISNPDLHRIVAHTNFPNSVTGDLYLATQVAGQFIFFANHGQNLTPSPTPYTQNTVLSGEMPLIDFSAIGVSAGRYPLFQVVTTPTSSPMIPANWITGLSVVNFNIGLPKQISADFDRDGFSYDDRNKDGFHDDDNNKDGFHDDDINKDGFHDNDLDKNGFSDGKQKESTLKSANSAIQAKNIEASGIVWNPDNSHYLIVSDEIFKKQSNVFVMDEEGLISANLQLQDNETIDDVESISLDNSYIYILSSLSHNEQGNLKASRKKFIRFKYLNQQIVEQQDIDLYEILKTVKDTNADQTLVDFLNKGFKNNSLDIESHFVRNNTLFLGFKSPSAGNGSSMIIKINDVEALFSGILPQLEIVKIIRLFDPETDKSMQLSDIMEVNGQLFMLSVSRSGAQKSILWHFQPTENTLEVIQEFSGLQAEGLTYNPEFSLITVVFDEGKSTSKYMFVPIHAASFGL